MLFESERRQGSNGSQMFTRTQKNSDVEKTCVGETAGLCGEESISQSVARTMSSSTTP